MASMFSGPPKPPPPAAPTLMPDPADPAIMAAKKRMLATDMGRSGRVSTLLSDDSEKMG